MHALTTSTDINPWISDVKMLAAGTTCSTAATTIGAQVTVGGNCWQHSNDDEYNVVDASHWAVAHNGNNADIGFFPIKRMAESTGLTLEQQIELSYPASHPPNRWLTKLTTTKLDVLGRFGDVVDFKD